MSVRKSQAVTSLLSVTIRVACPNGHETILDRECLVVDSGNCGHCQDYCQCDSPTVTAEWSCAQCPPRNRRNGAPRNDHLRGIYQPSYSVTVYGL